MQLLGLSLAHALTLLDAEPLITHTAPPFAPKNRVPIWGEARVLRVKQQGDRLELLVGRELLGEDKTPSPL